MQEYVVLIFLGYFAVGAFLMYIKFWRLITWMDAAFFEEYRGAEVELFHKTKTLRKFIRAAYPNAATLVWLTCIWPLYVLWGAFGAIMWLIFIALCLSLLLIILCIMSIPLLFMGILHLVGKRSSKAPL